MSFGEPLPRPRLHRPRASGPGFVYLLNDGYYTKIGIIATPSPDLDLLGRRLSTLQCGNAYQLAFSAWAWVASAITLEGALHYRLRRHQIRREWFKLTPAAQKWAIAQLATNALAPAGYLDVRNLLPLINRVRACDPDLAAQNVVESDSRVRRVDPKSAARVALRAQLDADPSALAVILRPPRMVCAHRYVLTGQPCRLLKPHRH